MSMVAHVSERSLSASSFKSVADMWHHRVGSTPDAEAMTYRADGAWTGMTWKEAGHRVERLSSALLAFGLKAEERCAIVSRTRVEWVLADMAILCAGGATTTVYPSSTAEETAYIAADCEARVIFAEDEEQVEKLRQIRESIPGVEKVVVFDGRPSDDGWVETLAVFEDGGRRWGEDNPGAYADAHESIEPDRLATLIYTSGTTGTPKGVMLTHDAWVYEAEALDALGLLTPADRQLLFLPLAHVFAKVMQVAFIRLGIPTIVDGDAGRLLDNMQQTRPTWAGAVPHVFDRAWTRIVTDVEQGGAAKKAMFKWALGIGRQVSQLRQEGREPRGLLKVRFALADRMVFSKIKAQFGGRIRFLISGGAPLSAEIAEFFHACDILVLEGYGLTESAAASTVNRPDAYRFGTVGQPLPGCEVRIAEDGEILLKSRGVMQGYYGLPEETAQVLTADGWLMTGDIGTILDTGHLKITDRKKELIVTAGGKNVAPARFQNLLKARCPYVSQAVLHGDNRPYCTALIALDESSLRGWAGNEGIRYADHADLASKPAVLALIAGYVDEVNKDLAPYEQAKKHALLPEDLTQGNGALTPSLKLKRRVVEERYSDVLDGMYA